MFSLCKIIDFVMKRNKGCKGGEKINLQVCRVVEKIKLLSYVVLLQIYFNHDQGDLRSKTFPPKIAFKEKCPDQWSRECLLVFSLKHLLILFINYCCSNICSSDTTVPHLSSCSLYIYMVSVHHMSPCEGSCGKQSFIFLFHILMFLSSHHFLMSVCDVNCVDFSHHRTMKAKLFLQTKENKYLFTPHYIFSGISSVTPFFFSDCYLMEI